MASHPWQRVRDHFADNVLPAATDYRQAEVDLSRAFREHGKDSDQFRYTQKKAIRCASQLAIAFDGLIDRSMAVEGKTRMQLFNEIAPFCEINGIVREGTLERIFSVANAYRHDLLKDGRNVIGSSNDVLAVGSGYGEDGYGVGKVGEPEVMVVMKDGTRRKFLGDGQMATAGWRSYLEAKGVDFAGIRII